MQQLSFLIWPDFAQVITKIWPKKRNLDVAELRKVLNKNKTGEAHFLNKYNLRSQEDVQEDCLLEVIIIRQDFQPLEIKFE